MQTDWWHGRTRAQRSLFLLALLIGVAVVVWLCVVIPSAAWDFRNNLWSPAHLLLTGRSPYRVDQLFDGSNTVWMPTAIGSFLPLGWLTLSQASVLWGIASLVAILGVGVWSARMAKPYPLWLAVALVAMFIFPPTITHFQWGQYGMVAMLCGLVAAQLLERQAPLWAVALCLVLGAAKPQLLPLTGLGVAVVVLRQRHAVGLARLVGYGLLWTGLFMLPLFILFPDWIDGLRWALARNPSWLQPSSLTALQANLGNGGVVVWVGLVIGALVGTVWLWMRTQPTVAAIWTLALTVLVTPYVWSYDFVLLIPLLIFTLFQVTSVVARLAWVAGYGMIWVAFVSLRLTSSNSDEIFWWVPAACLLLVLACWGISRRLPTTPQPATLKP